MVLLDAWMEQRQAMPTVLVSFIIEIGVNVGVRRQPAPPWTAFPGVDRRRSWSPAERIECLSSLVRATKACFLDETCASGVGAPGSGKYCPFSSLAHSVTLDGVTDLTSKKCALRAGRVVTWCFSFTVFVFAIQTK